MKELLRLVTTIVLISHLTAVSEETIYQTTCYQRQGNQLVNPQSCTVTMQFDHPENGLNWKIVTRRGQVYHYRNPGTGIELWSHLTQQWVNVTETNWLTTQEGILCWDNFCADWRQLPLD